MFTITRVWPEHLSQYEDGLKKLFCSFDVLPEIESECLSRRLILSLNWLAADCIDNR